MITINALATGSFSDRLARVSAPEGVSCPKGLEREEVGRSLANHRYQGTGYESESHADLVPGSHACHTAGCGK